MMIELIAPHAPEPIDIMEFHRVTIHERISDFLKFLLNSLLHRYLNHSASFHETQETLTHLQSLPLLTKWHEYIAQKLEFLQDYFFDHDDLGIPFHKLHATLQDKTPFNVHDLSALTVDIIEKLNASTRESSTQDILQYWNVDRYNRIKNPKPENACRDVLLSHLAKDLKPYGVNVSSETRIQHNLRADIILSYSHEQDLFLPVECKSSQNKNLFKGLTEQLKAYTCTSRSQHCGIFLVFWFGQKYSTTGVTSSKALQKKLNHIVSERKTSNIRCIVFDVSPQVPM